MQHAYPASSYDHYFCLKPSFLLWVAMIYLSRALTLPIAMAISSFAGVNADAIAIMRGFWSLDTVAPSLLALGVVATSFRRLPTAGGAVRWIWAHARVVLLIAAGLDLIHPAVELARGGVDLGDRALWSVLGAVVDLYFLAYIGLARRVRDTFADFPPPPPAPVDISHSHV